MSNDKRPLSEYSGRVYDMAYKPKELVYESVSDFINDISNKEIEIAMNDFPSNYQVDEVYQKYRHLKDSQEITEKELNELLDTYQYDIS